MVIVNMEIAEQLLCWYEERDVDAEAYYREFRLNDGNGLSPARVHDLTLKASILNTIERLLVSGVLFQGLRYKVDLQDLAAQIVYLRRVERIEIPLPGNTKELQKLLTAYRRHGYIALIY